MDTARIATKARKIGALMVLIEAAADEGDETMLRELRLESVRVLANDLESLLWQRRGPESPMTESELRAAYGDR
jgi:hypothetical protein